MLLAGAALRPDATVPFGQVIDVLVSRRRDANAARRFFERAIATTKVDPVEVVTDRAATYPVVLDGLLPAAWHRTEQYAKQPRRVRPRPVEGAPAADAWAKAGPQRQGDHRRACLRPERAARAVRVGHRGASDPASDGRLRRTRHRDLTLGDAPGLQQAPSRHNATGPPHVVHTSAEGVERPPVEVNDGRSLPIVPSCPKVPVVRKCGRRLERRIEQGAAWL